MASGIVYSKSQIDAYRSQDAAAFTEQVQDAVAALINSGTKSGITITYDDVNNRLNFTVAQQFTKSASAPFSPAVNDLWVDLS